MDTGSEWSMASLLVRRPLRTATSARKITLGAASAMLLVGSLAACTGGDDDPAGDTNGEPDQVTYLTSFGQLGRDAYVYLAEEQGFFEEAGIEVTIEAGAGMTGNAQALASGQVQFAVFDLGAATVAKGAGAEGAEDFVAIAAIHQLPPVALMATNEEITSPSDLEGRTVGIAPGTVTELLFDTYVEQAGGDPTQVTMEPVNPPELIQALASGQVDAIEQFAMGQPTVEAAVGAEVQVLPYSDYLTDLYGVVLMTTPEMVESNPELCVRFRDALLRGLQYSLDNPEEAGEALKSVVPEQDAGVAAQELEIMRAYSVPSVGPLGTIDADKVARSIALLQSLGVIDESVALAPEDLVAFDLVPTEAG